MSSLMNINGLMNASPEVKPFLPSLISSQGSDFDTLLNQLITQTMPGTGGKQSAIQAQAAYEAFEQKLDLLTGMAQQAEIAMHSVKPLPGGFSTPQAQTYFYAKSLLAQVGLPGCVLEVV